jgi:membrane-associated protease RseP (regulator of RpoE activity)
MAKKDGEESKITDDIPAISENGYRPIDVTELESGEATRGIKKWIAPLLFVLTLVTTLVSGARMSGFDPFQDPVSLIKGIPFSFTLMAILFVHEMGHYLTSKHYGVKTTPPYFIPGLWYPLGFGTFGAFIKMRSPILQKRVLLDIGAAGPIAGFVVALGAVVIGLQMSVVVEANDYLQQGLVFGNTLLFFALSHLFLQIPQGYDVGLHPIALAGWFGFFVTSINLLPIGQLDGGHISYALLGKHQRTLSILTVLVLIVLGAYGWPGWYIWAFLTLLLGVRHPPILDEDTSLNLRQKIVGWVSMALFILTFVPIPFDFK